MSEVSAYLDDVGRRGPLLSAAEESDLFRRARAGDSEARHRVIEANLKWSYRVAWQRRATFPMIPLPDLIQEANCALVRAFDSFDPSRGIRFTTYATACIVHWFWRVRGEYFLARLPANIVEAHAEEEYSLRCVQPEMLADRRQTWESLFPSSLGPPDQIAEEKEAKLIQGRLAIRVMAWLRDQPERTRAIVERRFGLCGGEEETLDRIGASFGISKERVRQVVNASLVKAAALAP